MDESEFLPKEGITGLSEKPCLVFGNGVEIETQVFAKTSSENEFPNPDGTVRRVLPKKIGPNATGTDVVKIHFLPSTTDQKRINDPDLVPSQFKEQIRKDCLQGFLALAQALNEGKVNIENHLPDEDFYLYADTSPQFAAFLRNRFGFRGNEGGVEAWVRKSEFGSDDRIEQLKTQLNSL